MICWTFLIRWATAFGDRVNDARAMDPGAPPATTMGDKSLSQQMPLAVGKGPSISESANPWMFSKRSAMRDRASWMQATTASRSITGGELICTLATLCAHGCADWAWALASTPCKELPRPRTGVEAAEAWRGAAPCTGAAARSRKCS